jgi:prevent-host-death family protein
MRAYELRTYLPHDYNDHNDYLRSSPMASQSWTVAQAKAKFSEVLNRAMADGPQTITRRGRAAAVVVNADEWNRKTRRVGTLADFFAASPLRNSGLKLKRPKGRIRKIDL